MKKSISASIGIATLLFVSINSEINAAQIITGTEVSNNDTHVQCNQCQCTATYRTMSKENNASNSSDYDTSWNLNITDDVLNQLNIDTIYVDGKPVTGSTTINATVETFTQADYAQYVADKREESLGVQWIPGTDPCAPGVDFQNDWSTINPNKMPSSVTTDTDKTTVTIGQSLNGQLTANIDISGISVGSGSQVVNYNCQGGGSNVKTQNSFPVKFSFDFTTSEDCDITESSGCRPTVSSDLACSPGYQMSDTDNWTSCIIPNSGGIFSVNAGGLDGNKYCKVTCREDISFSFPAADTYLAGNHFIYQPVKVTGKRECRSPQINWPQYYSDNESYNESYKTHYICSKTLTTSLVSCCEEMSTGNDKRCSSGPWGTVCNHYCKDYGQRWTSSCGGHSTSCSDHPGSNPQSSWRNAEYGAAMSAKAARDSAHEQIKKCFNWGPLYQLNTTSSVSYNDPSGNYSWSGSYAGSGGDSPGQMFGASSNPTIKWYTCSGTSCSNVTNTAPRNQSLESYTRDGSKIRQIDTFTKTFMMSASGVYQYVLKPSGISVHAGQQYGNYIDIGYSNFPIHYSTPSGTYYMGITFTNFGHNNRFSNGTAASVTSASTECPYNVENKLLDDDDDVVVGCPISSCATGQTLINPNSINCSCSGKESERCLITSCKAGYTLVNPNSVNCYCKPSSPPGGGDDLKGLNVIYRPIDLNNPFPAEDGDGRMPGSNWQGYFDNYVDIYITNNRDVTTNEVYNLTPIYKITLTPQIIKAIRDYNTEQKNDDMGYADFNLNCTVGTGKECIMTRFTERFGNIFDNVSTCLNKSGNAFNTCRY